MRDDLARLRKDAIIPREWSWPLHGRNTIKREFVGNMNDSFALREIRKFVNTMGVNTNNTILVFPNSSVLAKNAVEAQRLMDRLIDNKYTLVFTEWGMVVNETNRASTVLRGHIFNVEARAVNLSANQSLGHTLSDVRNANIASHLNAVKMRMQKATNLFIDARKRMEMCITTADLLPDYQKSPRLTRQSRTPTKKLCGGVHHLENLLVKVQRDRKRQAGKGRYALKMP
jgi:hypothetical protein